MDWQPIDTAPKDGKPLLAKLSCGREVIAEFWAGCKELEIPDGWALNVTHILDEEYGEIAYWKPLPGDSANETVVGPRNDTGSV